ncbi:MAG: apolipoprotein N-acyltransferase [Acidovorax sp.]|uniref:apolipoprotein N-acyltransferase n=1 Tax=Acidovorax sp. TaxID=1872122 RepID=UPI003918E83C
MAQFDSPAGQRLALQAPLAVAAGLAQAASLAWPWSGEALWWLQLVSMAVLAWLVRPHAHQAVGWRRGALMGGLFATAWLAGTFWWLFISLHTYGGLAAPLAVAAVLGLAAFLGSYYAAVLGLFCHLAPASKALTALLFGALWLLAELARGTLWTGFPWGAGGYAHVDGPLVALARYGGVYGIGAVAAVLAMYGVQLRGADLGRWRTWVLALVVVTAGLSPQLLCACSSTVLSRVPPMTLELLQGNIPQDEKFQQGSGVPVALQWYAQALRDAKADLVVAPETAIPLLPQQLMPGYLEGLQSRYAQGSQAALLGIPMGDEALGYSNSVLALSPANSGEPYRYDKHHLVPFGEFIPPFFKWFTAMMDIPLGDFNRGAVGQASFAWAGQRIAPNICYEDLFGEELGARFADPAQAPTVFVNFSNIGWFGNTIAIDQHLHISRMRALEFERPMVRATNTGATAIIDHRGVVTHQLERHTRGVLKGEVHGRGLDAQNGWAITPYAWWVSRWGLWPLWSLAGLTLLVALWVKVNQRGGTGRYP